MSLYEAMAWMNSLMAVTTRCSFRTSGLHSRGRVLAASTIFFYNTGTYRYVINVIKVKYTVIQK